MKMEKYSNEKTVNIKNTWLILRYYKVECSSRTVLTNSNSNVIVVHISYTWIFSVSDSIPWDTCHCMLPLFSASLYLDFTEGLEPGTTNRFLIVHGSCTWVLSVCIRKSLSA